MKTITVTPAYGRDYTSAKAAAAAWKEGKDFLLADPQSPWCGRPINVSGASDCVVKIRYARLTRATLVPVDGVVA
jgi:hypothetical protein